MSGLPKTTAQLLMSQFTTERLRSGATKKHFEKSSFGLNETFPLSTGAGVLRGGNKTTLNLFSPKKIKLIRRKFRLNIIIWTSWSFARPFLPPISPMRTAMEIPSKFRYSGRSVWILAKHEHLLTRKKTLSGTGVSMMDANMIRPGDPSFFPVSAILTGGTLFPLCSPTIKNRPTIYRDGEKQLGIFRSVRNLYINKPPSFGVNTVKNTPRCVCTFRQHPLRRKSRVAKE